MVRMSTRNRLIIGVIVVAAIFYVAAPMLRPKGATESKNARFNDWVKYFRRQEGYSVEYLNFAVFSEGVDVIRSMQALKMSTDIEDIYAEMGGVTVYYDWEVDRIFFIGSGLDPALMYGFYCTF